MTKWIDISQPLTNSIAHWPGDTSFQYETALTKEETGSVNIGRITTSAHIGTHVDAPFHFLNDGKRILDMDIDRYIGPCKVIDVSEFPAIDEAALKSKQLTQAERLLIRTSLPNNPERFPDEVPPVTPDGAAYMKKLGVKLVGVDTPSIDPVTSKDLAGHHALHENDIYILENVMLDHVEEGDYELVALPLPLKEADGSPVRAVIKPLEGDSK
ncbi:arylformamidase [Virgibacillus halodenitrificans]|jgi:arylformamidase|uniref:Kynurenine formamidase n=1 Tax=Virgibacillus halodenitrificans TaxID=1482 RepID=A0AAC9NKM0_VIRHA|nr:arylformamidase [Virgibacillus halodenitrificans]APC47844.1 arylformamidase [Virgibacillus halodenitrificans]MBD1224064.1 arylformamidase [Virgibacillus halodenitrificans]MCG1029091.1 arylformamidase [Virgibacillus halodenitrificans]MCJ0933260.1 arylformamidase [Virgibacillus halodenitrificans]MEC2160092.1 arylformamidase [Virgibacillus halodenitrificans]